MGLLDDQLELNYYQGNSKGDYQFTSLDDIINYFMVVYVGEGKTISKVNRTDVAFHAQRAMQELSFDTFKSVKSQEIVLPPSNTMTLPHDYVNYTKISWSDNAGIKHPLYPTSNTSNPFKILQESDGSYEFRPETAMLINPGFTIGLDSWDTSKINAYSAPVTTNSERIHVDGGRLAIQTIPRLQQVQINQTRVDAGKALQVGYSIYSVWQKIDVSSVDTLDFSADGESTASVFTTGAEGPSGDGILRLGISSFEPNKYTSANPNHTNPAYGVNPPDISYLEWDEGISGSMITKAMVDVDVSSYNDVWVVITSYVPWGTLTTYVVDPLQDLTSSPIVNDSSMNGWDNREIQSNGITTNYRYNFYYGTSTTSSNFATNYIDNISVTSQNPGSLTYSDSSTTWDNYKSSSSNDNSNPEIHSYDTDIYDLNVGERYGLSPEHAQVNGSYYIDNLRGLINFSSNVSGKTVILDYISDSLGTDGEMQVHKFAEEAMYKWIMYAVLSTKANMPEHIVRRYKKERFAATRTAKLRLSNIKLEELTQILRGKSKHIKH